jgi:hypothetical protein
MTAGPLLPGHVGTWAVSSRSEDQWHPWDVLVFSDGRLKLVLPVRDENEAAEWLKAARGLWRDWSDPPSAFDPASLPPIPLRPDVAEASPLLDLASFPQPVVVAARWRADELGVSPETVVKVNLMWSALRDDGPAAAPRTFDIGAVPETYRPLVDATLDVCAIHFASPRFPVSAEFRDAAIRRAWGALRAVAQDDVSGLVEEIRTRQASLPTKG